MKNIDQIIQDAVQRTVEIAHELNRTPLKMELMSGGVSRHTIEKYCGGYEKLVSMAGLNPHSHFEARHIQTKPTNAIFNKQIPETLNNKTIDSPRSDATLLIAGDMHLPWVHEPTMKLFHEFNGDMKPDYVIQIGDLYDMYAHARFPKSSNIYTPREEEARARADAERFWTEVAHRNPSAKRKQFKGNHDIRPVKQALEKAPNLEHFVDAYMEKLFTFDGVETYHDARDIVRIEGYAFHHGYLQQIGMHRDAILENAVVGHTHLGGVSYRALRDRTIWELNVGLMGDPESKVMSYTATKETKWTLGFGFIDKHGPRFIAT